MKRFNWQIWTGLLLSIIAFLSYPLFFVKFAITRDFPWASLLLFAVAIGLALLGLRRAWSRPKTEGEGKLRFFVRRTIPTVAATLSVVILGLFIFTVFIFARWMPASQGAPHVGQKAPEFTLSDTNGKTVALAQLLSSPIGVNTAAAGVAARSATEAQTPPKGVLLIFYRGYW
jgi:membrane protease YdiL (CAAX protease family)